MRSLLRFGPVCGRGQRGQSRPHRRQGNLERVGDSHRHGDIDRMTDAGDDDGHRFARDCGRRRGRIDRNVGVMPLCGNPNDALSLGLAPVRQASKVGVVDGKNHRLGVLDNFALGTQNRLTRLHSLKVRLADHGDRSNVGREGLAQGSNLALAEDSHFRNKHLSSRGQLVVDGPRQPHEVVEGRWAGDDRILCANEMRDVPLRRCLSV